MKHFIYIKENSKRVKDKNFVFVGGQPLWGNLVSELTGEDVYIDTDSEVVEFACRSIDHVTCYKRLQKHIDIEEDEQFNLSPALLMIDRFLDMYVEDENEIIVTPHVTSPFIKLETIKDAAKKLEEGYDSVQACTVHQEFAYYKDEPINFEPSVVQKTQDLEPIKLGNGAFFIFTKKTFKENKNRVGKKPFLYPLSMPESIEIDTYQDLSLARMWTYRG